MGGARASSRSATMGHASRRGCVCAGHRGPALERRQPLAATRATLRAPARPRAQKQRAPLEALDGDVRALVAHSVADPAPRYVLGAMDVDPSGRRRLRAPDVARRAERVAAAPELRRRATSAARRSASRAAAASAAGRAASRAAAASAARRAGSARRSASRSDDVARLNDGRNETIYGTACFVRAPVGHFRRRHGAPRAASGRLARARGPAEESHSSKKIMHRGSSFAGRAGRVGWAGWVGWVGCRL